jgi:hypothetical protein
MSDRDLVFEAGQRFAHDEGSTGGLRDESFEFCEHRRFLASGQKPLVALPLLRDKDR